VDGVTADCWPARHASPTLARQRPLLTHPEKHFGGILTALIVTSVKTDSTLGSEAVIGWPVLAAIIAWTVAAIAASIPTWGSPGRIKDKIGSVENLVF